jgi:hypothetical protein
MHRTLTAVDWLKKQPWSTRLMISGAFASVSVFAWFMGRIWPWGYVMAIVPLVVRRGRSRSEDEFFREVKPTNEVAPVIWRTEGAVPEFVKALERLSRATTSGFMAEKINDIAGSVGALPEGQRKQFSYVAMFDGRPVSLQITVQRISPECFALAILTDPQLVAKFT